MTIEQVMAMLPVEEEEIRLTDVDGLPRYGCVHPVDLFEESQAIFRSIIEVEQHQADRLKSWYIIGYEDMYGDLLCVDLVTGQVMVVGHETLEREEVVAPSLTQFLQG